MSKLPHWPEQAVEKTVRRDINLLDDISLEDGLFYGDSLVIIDSVGKEIPTRLKHQDVDETERAGVGIYGGFTITKNAVNPCLITYIPRFTAVTENDQYVAKSFDRVRDANISRMSPNVDPLIAEKVSPEKNAKLSFGNFANTDIMVQSLNRLTETLSNYYYDIYQLPNAIEVAYLTSKDSFSEVLTAMRSLEVKEPNEADILTDSVRILSRPPSGEMFGNYIYLCYRDESCTYRNVEYKLKRGDICVINLGELDVLRYGSNYSDRAIAMIRFNNNLAQMADKHQPSLATYNKDVSKAVDEFKESNQGYFEDSLYLDTEIIDSRLFENEVGTIIGIISKPFQYQDIDFENGDILLIHDGLVKKLGISGEINTQVIDTSAELTGLVDKVNAKTNPLLELKKLNTTHHETEIPDKTKGDISVDGPNLTIMGRDFSRNDLGVELRNKMAEVMGDRYLSNAEALTLISQVPDTVDQLRANNDLHRRAIEKVNAIPKGTPVLISNTLHSTSNWYISGTPLEIVDNRLVGHSDMEFDLVTVRPTDIRYHDGIIYTLSPDGVHVAEEGYDSVRRPSNVGSPKNVDDIFIINDKVGYCTYIDDSSLLEIDGGATSVSGKVIGSIPGTEVVLVIDNEVVLLKNLNTGRFKSMEIDCDSSMVSGESLILLKGRSMVAVIKDGEIYPFVSSADMSQVEYRYGYPHPSIVVPDYDASMGIIVL